MSQLKQAERNLQPFSALCSIQALNGWDDAHPPWGEPSALLSLPIRMLTFP